MTNRATDLRKSRFGAMGNTQPQKEEFADDQAPLRLVRSEVEDAFDKAANQAAKTPRGRLASKVTIPKDELREMLDEWIADCEYEGQSKKTLEGKRSAIRLLLRWLDQEEIEQCGKMEVKRYLSYLASSHLLKWGRWDEGLRVRDQKTNRVNGLKSRAVKPRPDAFRPISDQTMRLYFIYIKGYFDFLASEEISVVPASPLEGIKAPRANKATIRPFTTEEVGALLRAAKNGRSPKRDVALIYFLLDSGARVSEVAALKGRDIRMKNGVATVLHGKGDKQRDICFESDTRRFLVAYLRESPCGEDEHVFRAEGGTTPGWGLTADGITKLISRLGKKAGISEKRCSPHTFRHTYATWFLREGGAAKALQVSMGHVDMQQTMEYVGFVDSDVKNQHRRASPAKLLRENRNA